MFLIFSFHCSAIVTSSNIPLVYLISPLLNRSLFKGLMPPMSFTESSRYSLKKSTIDGRTEIYLTPLELLDRLSKLRRAVIETAGPSGATLQVLQEAQQAMGLEEELSELQRRQKPDHQRVERLCRKVARN